MSQSKNSTIAFMDSSSVTKGVKWGHLGYSNWSGWRWKATVQSEFLRGPLVPTKEVKSTHIHYLLFISFTETILQTHVGNCTSLMKLADFNLSSSSTISHCLFGANILFFCSTTLASWFIFSLCTTTSRSSLRIFVGDQANPILFYLSKEVSSLSSTSINSVSAKVVLSWPSRSTFTDSFWGSIILSLRLPHSFEVLRINVSCGFITDLTKICNPFLPLTNSIVQMLYSSLFQALLVSILGT